MRSSSVKCRKGECLDGKQFRNRTRIKIIQKTLSVFQYPHLIDATP